MYAVAWGAFLCVVAGASVLIQQAMNAHLRSALSSAMWSGLASYILGFACMIAFALLIRDPLPSVTCLSRVSWWAWTGGVFGAIFVGLSMLTLPTLGGATFVALLVAGQMIAALALDQFGWLGVVQRPIDSPRLLGVLLIVGGVFLFRR